MIITITMRANRPVIYEERIEVPDETTEEQQMEILRQKWDNAPNSVERWLEDPLRNWSLSEYSIERPLKEEQDCVVRLTPWEITK